MLNDILLRMSLVHFMANEIMLVFKHLIKSYKMFCYMLQISKKSNAPVTSLHKQMYNNVMRAVPFQDVLKFVIRLL